MATNNLSLLRKGRPFIMRGADPAPAGSATVGEPPPDLPSFQATVRQPTDQPAHTSKEMYAPP